MSMSPLHSVHADEPSEIEEIIKVEVDEQHLPPLQYVYETDETSDEDPVMKKKPLDECPLENKGFIKKWWNSKRS